MYIAVIADNIASRKHMERLLDRTSDAIMATTGNLYIEAYGDPASMWPLIKRYDLFFVDITQDNCLKEHVINRLMELNLNSQTVILENQDENCSSWPSDHGFLSMKHPLSIPALSQLVTEIHTLIRENSEKKKILEFRCEDTTHYIDADQILYAVEKEYQVEICLLDGSVNKMLGDIFDFYRCVEGYAEFSLHNRKVVINCNHVKKIKGRTITLLNDQTKKLPVYQNSLFEKILIREHD